MSIKVGQTTDFQKFALLNPILHPAGSAPSSPTEGQAWYDSANHQYKYWDGTAWVLFGAGGISFAAPSATINAGDSAAAGAASTALRSDAQFAVATAAASAISNSNAEGSSTSLARADHNHAIAADTITAAELRDDGATDGNRAVTTDHIRNANVTLAKLASDVTAYIDDRAGGMDPKGSVRAVEISNINTASPGASHDGVTLSNGDRLLLVGQSTISQNGIFVYNGAASALTRPTDADSAGDLSGGAFTWVEEGTTYADTQWTITTNGSITPGTTAHAWTQSNALGQITAGAGLTKTGATLDIGAGTGITVNADTIQISASYAGQASIVTVGTITSGTWTGTDIAVADGGTGAGTAAAARDNLAGGGGLTLTRKYSATVGDGSATSFNVDHNLGTDDVVVSVRKVSTGDIWDVEKTVSTTNRVVVVFGTAPTTNEYEVTVVG